MGGSALRFKKLFGEEANKYLLIDFLNQLPPEHHQIDDLNFRNSENMTDLIWVTNAEYLSNYKIELTFNDGLVGVADFKDGLNADIFKPLQNLNYFKQFKRNSWTIEWGCNVDFAPEYLYNLVKNQQKVFA